MIDRTEGARSSGGAAMDEHARATGAVATRVEGAPAVLPAPDLVAGDPVAIVAKLLVENAQHRKASDEITATLEERAEDAADARRVEAMKDRADHAFAAGVVVGASQALAGACGPIGAFCARGKEDKFLATVLSRWEGAGKVEEGIGKIAETSVRKGADAADQDAARAESEAKVAKRAHEALHKQTDTAAQHEGKVIQLLQEIKQAQAQCERAALLRMA